MAKWRLRRGMPDWHEICDYTETLPDGTVITAQTEDCDGDVEYWSVKEDGVLVAFGEFTSAPFDQARRAAEKVINFGATEDQRQRAAEQIVFLAALSKEGA